MASRCCVPPVALQPGRCGPCLHAPRWTKAACHLSLLRRPHQHNVLVHCSSEEPAEVPEGPSRTLGDGPSEVLNAVTSENLTEVSGEGPSDMVDEEPDEEASGGFIESIFGVREEGNDPLPANYSTDAWDGEQWEWLGAFMNAFIPILIVSGLVVGGLAASFYNEGATVFVQGPSAEGEAPQVFVAPDEDVE